MRSAHFHTQAILLLIIIEYGMQIGSAMEVVHLSFALADRINILRRQVRGKKKPIVLYEVFEGDPEELRARKIETWPKITAAMSVYKAGDFEDARKAFQDLHEETRRTVFRLCI